MQRTTNDPQKTSGKKPSKRADDYPQKERSASPRLERSSKVIKSGFSEVKENSSRQSPSSSEDGSTTPRGRDLGRGRGHRSSSSSKEFHIKVTTSSPSPSQRRSPSTGRPSASPSPSRKHLALSPDQRHQLKVGGLSSIQEEQESDDQVKCPQIPVANSSTHAFPHQPRRKDPKNTTRENSPGASGRKVPEIRKDGFWEDWDDTHQDMYDEMPAQKVKGDFWEDWDDTHPDMYPVSKVSMFSGKETGGDSEMTELTIKPKSCSNSLLKK